MRRQPRPAGGSGRHRRPAGGEIASGGGGVGYSDPPLAPYETVREYARQRLREANEADAVAQRCEAWYLALAQAARCGLAGPNQASWLATLDSERANLAEAIRSALVHRPADAAGLAGRIWRFWILKGHLREGRRSLEAVLTTPAADGDRLLTLLGGVAIQLRTASGAPAKARVDEAVRLATTLDDPALLGEATHLAGLVFLMAGEYQRGLHCWRPPSTPPTRPSAPWLPPQLARRSDWASGRSAIPGRGAAGG